MANVTASLSCAQSVAGNQQFVVTCVIANAGASAVTVSHIEASVSPPGGGPQSAPYSMGVPPLGPNNPNSVPASGTLTLSWPCVIHSPQSTNALTVSEPPAQQYQVNAVITTSDATPITYAAPAPVNVASLIPVASVALGNPVAPNSNPGAGAFYLPANSGVYLMVGM